MTYTESANLIDVIRSRDMMMFRMAISHLMDVGIRNLTKENINETCEAIMQQDDSKSFMSNRYMCDLVRMAGELAEIDHIHLLNYISKNVFYDVGDKQMHYDRAVELLGYMVYYVKENTFRDIYTELCDIGFDDDDIEAIGYPELIPNYEEEEE